MWNKRRSKPVCLLRVVWVELAHELLFQADCVLYGKGSQTEYHSGVPQHAGEGIL